MSGYDGIPRCDNPLCEAHDHEPHRLANGACELCDWIGDRTHEPDCPSLTADWGEVAMLPKGKYVVKERDDGWHVYAIDNHGAFT